MRLKNVVRGAVDDAVDLEVAVAGERLAKHAHDRNAAADAGFEAERHAGVLGRARKRRPAAREQRLVGRDHRLAGGDGLAEKAAGRLDAAHELDDDVDVGIVDELPRVLDEHALFELHAAVAPRVEIRHADYIDGEAEAAGDL